MEELIMYNWFVDKNKIKNNMICAIMEEMDSLVNETCESANYWIDSTHNVFAFINDNGNDDKWIEIHYELYDDKDIIGDLFVMNTDDVDRDELLKEVAVIVDNYYGN